MEGPEWLRIQLDSFTCPACGEHYRGSPIKLLAERDGLFFVDLDCRQCGSHTVAIVSFELDDAEAAIANLSPLPEVDDRFGEALPNKTSPVTADDVLDMHEFLAHFEGDVDSLFRAHRRTHGAQ